MSRLFVIIAAAAVAWAPTAHAVSTFSASAAAGVSVSTNSAGGLGDLGYRGSRVSYAASAQATFDIGVIVDLEDTVVAKTGNGASFESIFLGGESLASLLLKPAGKPIPFGAVSAVSDEAEGKGDFSIGDSGASFSLTANASGKAIDTGDPAFGNAKVRWDVSISFENLSDAAMVATWSVNHVLSAAAAADPRGTAFALALFETAGAPDVINAAADPPIGPNGNNGDGLKPDPPILSGATNISFAIFLP